MNIPAIAGAALVALLGTTSPMLAASEGDCATLWQKTDINSDNVLTKEEDLQTYMSRVQNKKPGVADPEKMTREEFLSHCKDDVFTTSIAAVPDTPKGSVIEKTAAPAAVPSPALMPGANSFTEEQARKRIEGSGYTSVGPLKKDANGVWRGTAMRDGHTLAIGLDFQGNIATN